MRVGGSKPPSKSGMSWLKQKEQQGGWSDIGTPGSEADHPRRVVECLTRRCLLAPEWAAFTADPTESGNRARVIASIHSHNVRIRVGKRWKGSTQPLAAIYIRVSGSCNQRETSIEIQTEESIEKACKLVT